MDIPERTDDSANVIIYGVESEQIEEENDAYQDMRYELGERNEENFCGFPTIFLLFSGIHTDREDELDELMPSCFCLNVLDCISIRLSSLFCSKRRR